MIEKPAATVAVADDNTAPETKPVNTAATLPTTPTTTVTQPAIKPAITTNNGSNPINHAPGIDAHANAAPIPAATPAVVKVVDNNGLLPLQTEVKHIQQTVSTYQQETEARLVQLSQQNTTTQNRISHIETTLNHINQQLNKITDPAVAVTASKPEAIPTKVNFISAPLSHHQKSVLQHLVAKWWIIALAILVLLLVWIPWPDKKTVKKRPQSQPNKVIEEDEESEYDYLSSHEAIPAKLDLARAYIDMDDIESATRVLQEVILQGNDSQRHQAKQLLGTIRPHLV
ncbi:MAG: hypothetical protein HWD59_11875 [Coxiellaceae bacterium]|nr:MAG: hypothetical protein HWD59_11875 [Coxiellaceae bacterium]